MNEYEKTEIPHHVFIASSRKLSHVTSCIDIFEDYESHDRQSVGIKRVIYKDTFVMRLINLVLDLQHFFSFIDFRFVFMEQTVSLYDGLLIDKL